MSLSFFEGSLVRSKELDRVSLIAVFEERIIQIIISLLSRRKRPLHNLRSSEPQVLIFLESSTLARLHTMSHRTMRRVYIYIEGKRLTSDLNHERQYKKSCFDRDCEVVFASPPWAVESRNMKADELNEISQQSMMFAS